MTTPVDIIYGWVEPATASTQSAAWDDLKNAASALVAQGACFVPVKLSFDRSSFVPLAESELAAFCPTCSRRGPRDAQDAWFLVTPHETTQLPLLGTVLKMAQGEGWRLILMPNDVALKTREMASPDSSYDLVLALPRSTGESQPPAMNWDLWAATAKSKITAAKLDVAPPAEASIQLRCPVLSICVTTYNRAAWLARSLPLILEQASPYRDLVEVVVCDNASPDNTPELAEQLLKAHSFSYHRNAENVGMLGNLGVSCDLAQGQYTWVIGDDDLLIDGTVERILAAIAKYPRTELIYTNYAYTRFNRPEDINDVSQVIRSAKAISPQIQDEFAERVCDIATKSENCFTAIYCLVYRSDHARAAYHQDTSGRPFSSLSTSVPTAEFVCRRLFDRPGYWIGDPCVVVNMNVSWLRYASLFILERYPELFDLMQEMGVDADRMDVLRSKHVSNLPGWFERIYQGPHKENLPFFSAERLVKRFGHLPAFRAKWPKMRRVYEKAFRKGQVEDTTLTPQRLDELLQLHI